MNKKIVAILSAGLMSLSILSACSSNSNDSNDELQDNLDNEIQEENLDLEEDDSSKIIYDDSLIKESVSKEGSITDEYGYELEYSYHIPNIIDDTKDAEEINKSIESSIGKEAVDSLSTINAGEYFTPFYYAGWESYWNGSILSLVLKGSYDSDYDIYEVYNYDFESGKRISNEELMAIAGTSSSAFIESLKNYASSILDERFGDLPSDIVPGLNELKEMTLDSENINIGMPIFLNKEQKLCAVTMVATPAGAGFYPEILIPDIK